MTAMAQSEDRLRSAYDPESVERRIYEMWESRGLFLPDETSDAEPFVITIPPPNVTGDLHMGHLLTYTIEDVVGRHARMQGRPTLILPGSDHASIAVHARVEALLRGEGVMRRFDIGREAFLLRAWEWKTKYADNIRGQFRALGEGYDWTRERFTMDPPYIRAVLKTFVQLYDEGYIYRGARVINWCFGCQTGISDIEVRQEQREDKLYFVRMPLEDDPNGGLTVATARPETMFGDVAVAVHPEDPRFNALIGRTLRHPLTGDIIPILGDDFVDREFGTGAVKITPAHDPADFEVGERHDLPMPIVITHNSTMADSVGNPFAGLPVLEARRKVEERLTAGGFMEKTEPLIHNVPLCDRCGTLIEPLLSEQWFMRMTELAQPAIDAVKDGRVRFVPERWTRVYLDWMENLRPWNISRQLWWGHRIPIYHCANGHVTCSIDPPGRCAECGSTEFEQDPDILDTWFSAALWPFATLGWPEKTSDLESYYPTSFMNTSSQILYLWIARMIMMGLHFMDEVPFPVVFISPTILNDKGERMSKSLGTGVDLLETVDQYGADASRFAVLSAGSLLNQEVRLTLLFHTTDTGERGFRFERAEEGQKFANKIWNATRLVLGSLDSPTEDGDITLTSADRWILSRLERVTADVSRCMESCDLSVGLRGLYDFIWSEFADWYLEMAKIRMRDGDHSERRTVHAVLWSVLERSMRLLHPYMPFVTEEVWMLLRDHAPRSGLELSALSLPLSDTVMLAPWPETPAIGLDEAAEAETSLVMRIVSAIRTLRSQYNVKPSEALPATYSSEGTDRNAVDAARPLIAGLARLSALEYEAQSLPGMAEVVVGETAIRIPLDRLTDVTAESARVAKDLTKAQGDAERLRTLLANPAFVGKAPAAVVSKEQDRLRELEDLIQRLRQQVDRLERPFA
jgi:valyl-tRNA synthetase